MKTNKEEVKFILIWLFVLAVVLFLFNYGHCQEKSTRAIYGTDDRHKESEVSPEMQRLGAVTCALVPVWNIMYNGNGKWLLSSTSMDENSGPFCDGEPFKDDPAPAFCSGFWVGGNRVVSAGHCAKALDWRDIVVVFNFVDSVEIDDADVFFLAKKPFKRTKRNDYSIFTLDGIPDIEEPLKLDSGPILVGTPLIVIGHPVGLSRTYDYGEVKYWSDKEKTFQASLDTYGGNSGSMVVDLSTNHIVGILINGNGDWRRDKKTKCRYSKVYSVETGNRGRFEGVQKIGPVVKWLDRRKNGQY